MVAENSTNHVFSASFVESFTVVVTLARRVVTQKIGSKRRPAVLSEVQDSGRVTQREKLYEPFLLAGD